VPPSGEKKLPEANEFSPGQVRLREVLELAKKHDGKRDALIEAIRKRYFANAAQKQKDPAKRLKLQQTRSYNVLVGMKGYGLFDLETISLTPDGTALLAITDDDSLAEGFAAHILRSCHGLEVLEAVRAIQARGERATKARLQTELETRGFKLPRATTHHTKLLQWLREASVLDKQQVIDEARIAALSGVRLETLEEWSTLTQEQRAFLRTLRRLATVHGTDALAARDLVSEAKFEHGPIFREDQLASRVFQPLESAGWITRTVVGGGRGGKSGDIAATPRLIALDLDVLPSEEGWGIPAELRPKLNTPLNEINEGLKSDSKHTKGIALELLALRISTDAALTPLRFRLRAAETGGGEVDLIAEGAHLHFARWLFQCKNTRTVALSDLAKEVGMAVLLRAHVIVLVTTGRFAKSVETYARELMDSQPLQVVLIDGKVLTRYRAGGLHALMGFLHEQAEATMRVKRAQVERHVAVGDV
jgi:hypothetical protein